MTSTHTLPFKTRLHHRQYRVLPSITPTTKGPVHHRYLPPDPDQPPGSTYTSSLYKSQRDGRRWPREAVHQVVRRYLDASQYGANGSVEQTPSFCPCCSDRNKENATRRTRTINDNDSHRSQSPESRDTGIYSGNIGMYRSESPDFSKIPLTEQSEGSPYNTTVHLEHPVIRRSNAYRGYRDETEKKLIKTSEEVLEASSKYRDAMKRLNQTAEYLQK